MHPMMCWFREQYFRQCGHWGIANLESYCERGKVTITGCGDKWIEGPSESLDGLCPTCKYQRGVKLLGVEITHISHPSLPPVPFSRRSVEEKPLRMTAEAMEQFEVLEDARIAVRKREELRRRQEKPLPQSPGQQPKPWWTREEIKRLKNEEIDRQLMEEQHQATLDLHETLQRQNESQKRLNFPIE
jgi:hypothetical protein